MTTPINQVRISALSDDALGTDDAVALAGRIADGELHPRELVDAAIGGGPAISLPLSEDGRGLPIGLQFSADVGAEAVLLGLALELEQAIGWPDPQVANEPSDRS